MWKRAARARPRSRSSPPQSATRFSTRPVRGYARCRSRRTASKRRLVRARDRDSEDIVKRSAIVAAAPGCVVWSAVFAHGRGAATLAPEDASYSLESRAAIGAHHLCSGLWVVGSVYKRTADQVLAQDIEPFKDFSWDKSFKYNVDSGRRTVTVSGSNFAARTAIFNDD